jgi:hypothetical protein
MRIADKLIQYLKDYGDKRIKSYYYGDPLTIPASNLPAIIVSKSSSIVSHGATGMDDTDRNYSIKLIFNKKDELGKNPSEVTVQRTMADIIEGTESAGTWTPTSIIGVIRKSFTLGNSINDQIIRIEYFLAERGDLITEEAEIIINIKDFVSVDGRS